MVVRVEPLYRKRKTSGYRVVKDGGSFFLKVFHGKEGLFKGLTNLAVSSRPKREFVFSSFLRRRGVDAVNVLSYREKKRLGLLPVNVGCTLSEFVEGATPLDWLVGEEGFEGLLFKAVSVAAKLHSLGVAHGDLSLSNFLVVGERLILVDLENARRLPTAVASFEFPDFVNDAVKFSKMAGEELEVGELFRVYFKELELSFPLQRALKFKMRRLLEGSGNSG